jgi:hypothetical protein
MTYSQFVIKGQVTVLDLAGTPVTDRTILEQLAFEPMVNGAVYSVHVDTATNPAILTPQQLNININTQR